MHAFQPTHTQLDGLPASLQALGQDYWLQFVEQHSPSSTRQQQLDKWLPWVFALSEFTAKVVLRYGEDAIAPMYRRQPGEHAERIQSLLMSCDTEAKAMACMRRYRNIEMARLAAQDLLGELSVPDFLQANSELADALIEAAATWVTESLSERFGYAYDSYGERMPLVIVAMGKLGGSELNFSSDIDLIFCFEHAGQTQGGRQSVEHSVYFTRLGQGVIKLLGQSTVDGQAFRVDMRLRPFGQSGPIAISFSAMEDYYQEQGRNWERYAMVKARYLNASERVAKILFDLLRPFVYRRYIDYSAIEALRKMKLLINQEARRRGVSNNVKLGLGGIREVEFIAQTFQLIRGGRERDLQTGSLLKALHVCEKLQLLDAHVTGRLHYAYLTLRKVEHVLQQLRDEQTQTLPDEPIDQLRLAHACGFADYSECRDAIQAEMTFVHSQFLNVVGSADEFAADEDSTLAILWQDLLDDATAQDVLQEAGVDKSATGHWWAAIHQCRQQVLKRSPGTRGRELLASLVPRIVEQIIAQQGNDKVLGLALSIIEKIASRTAYLELLVTNPGALQQLIILCEASPWIAHQLARYPHLLDELIDPQQLYDLPVLTSYRAEVQEFLNRIPQGDMEAQVEALRQVKQSFQLKIAAADVSDGVTLMRVSDHLTFLAEAVIEQVVALAWQQLTDRHGAPPGRDLHNSGFAVLAYGKLGGLELGYGSDLDLVFVCDDLQDVQTQGPRPIDAQQFYLRFAQRVLHLFTARTLSGVLYDVDMRLRPSGKSGLMVIQLKTYDDYLSHEAWTWELQALVRARMVFGHANLARRFQAIRLQHLAQPRDLTQLRTEIVAMREKMRGHLWQHLADGSDVKQMPGGMTDIEFITQFLVLGYAHQYPQLCEYSDNIRILECAQQVGLLTSAESEGLIEHYKRYRATVHRLALAEQEGVSTADFSAASAWVIQVWQRLLNVSLATRD